MKMNQKGKGLDNYCTPQFLFNHLDATFDFTLDAACDNKNFLRSNFGWQTELRQFTNEIIFKWDGLCQSWGNNRVFCNPPFSEKDKWIEKAYREVIEGDCPVCVMILPTLSMTTAAWHKYIHGNFFFQFSPSRYSFINPETNKPQKGNNSGTTVVYFIEPLPKETSIVKQTKHEVYL